MNPLQPLRQADVPPRVLHLITRMIVGGAQENTLQTVQGLRRLGWEAELVTGPQAGPEGSLLDEVRAAVVPFAVEPALVREVDPARDLRALLRLTRLLRRRRYAVVHTHSSKAGILGRVAGRLARVPAVVHTVHGWGFHERQALPLRWFYIGLERACRPLTQRLVVVSAQDACSGVRAGIGGAADYVLIRSGVELERYRLPPGVRAGVRRELGLPPAAPVVGTVTRLSPQKAPLDWVEAAAEVATRVPAARFLVVGDGPLRPQVEARVRQLGLGERFRFTGLRRDVPQLMQAMDVFLLTSLWEGLPRVLPKAMAAGLPVVATRVGGSAEIVRHGSTGVLVPAANPLAAAQAVIDLLLDESRRETMGGAGRQRVGAEFSSDTMVRQIADLYRQLLGCRARSVGGG